MKKRVAVIGSNGAIGNSICENLIDDDSVEEVYKFSRVIKSEDTDKIKNIEIGEFLENDIEVLATLNIKNVHPDNPYYKIWSDKLESYIYVTATHKILDTKNGFIPVETYSRATKTNIQPIILNCLITDNHQIPIGEYIFWDWED